MEKKLTPRWLIIKLTGILFALYSAYNVFIIIKNNSDLPPEGILISAVVALLFALYAVFAWTNEIENIRFTMIRRWVFIGVSLAVFALKLRMIGKVAAYLDFSLPHTVLYGGAYFLSLAALLILFVYYAFILNNYPFYPRAAVLLLAFAAILFLCCLVLEAILFFAYGIGLESSPLRTMVIRPIFYLGFIGLSVFFLFPPQINGDRHPRQQDDDIIMGFPV